MGMVYWAVVGLILFYGCATWPVRVDEERILVVFDCIPTVELWLRRTGGQLKAWVTALKVDLETIPGSRVSGGELVDFLKPRPSK